MTYSSQLRPLTPLVTHWQMPVAGSQASLFAWPVHWHTEINGVKKNRAIFVWPWKMVSVSVRYLFYQPMDEKIKTWTLRFPAKENPNMEKALFDWPIVLQYDVKAKYRLISRKFFGHWFFSAERSLNQPKATHVCIRSINQSNSSISVRLLLPFCSRVLISRSSKNRFNHSVRDKDSCTSFTDPYFVSQWFIHSRGNYFIVSPLGIGNSLIRTIVGNYPKT